MDRATERHLKGRVLRRFAREIAALGFRRTKPSFFTRPKDLLVQFIHLHKYTFAPEFRAHFGIRAVADPFSAVALNGPNSHPYQCKGGVTGRKYTFVFSESDETNVHCVAELVAFCRDVAEPWFQS